MTVELGGKDAMVVLSDAHVARAAAGALWAGCAAAGQARGAVERIYAAPEIDWSDSCSGSSPARRR